jgi:hypothetical protein
MILIGAADAQLAALEAGGASRKDALAGAKTVVGKLTGVLQQEQTDEESKKKYCEAKLDEKDSEKAVAEEEISRLDASINRKTADAAQLAGEVKDIEAALDAMEKSLDKAGVLRKSEKSIYESGTKDRALAEKVLKQAKQILTAHYKKAFIQRQPSTETPGSSSKELQSQGALGLLDMVREDIAKEQKDAEQEEKAAAMAFDKLTIDSRNEFDAKMQEIIERKQLRAKTLVQLGSDKETKTQKAEDRAAIVQQLTSLHQECDDLLKHFDQRTKARLFEVGQLKDVMDILSGSSGGGGGRSGSMFSQQPEDAMDQKEAALLADMSRAAKGLQTQ